MPRSGHRAEEGPAAGRASPTRPRRGRAGGGLGGGAVDAGEAVGRPPASGRARPAPSRPEASSLASRPRLVGRRSARRLQAVELPQLADHLGQALALDELHGVVVHAPLAADGVDRHDVGVVQAGGGLGLELEPLELPGVERRGEGQDLQRHAAAERDLLGLVDDAHAAAADLAEDPEVAQLRRSAGTEAASRCAVATAAAGHAAQLRHRRDGREHPPRLLDPLGMLPGDGPPVHRLAGLELVGQLVDQSDQDRVGLAGRQQLARSLVQVDAPGAIRPSDRGTAPGPGSGGP